MRKKKLIKNHPLKEDFKYSSLVVSELINKVMLSGLKEKASRIVYSSFDDLEKKFSTSPLTILEQALENLRPKLELRTRKIGGANCQVPFEVEPKRALTLTLRWIVEAARKRKANAMSKCLSLEIIDAFNKTGEAFKKKENIQKMAISNLAFSSYRF
ncbi:MAG: 30S ribosomal protein S7 [Mycoplasmataceae bacterium]|nr:MAG: 30S ribosomal protein S7 [Mycoplasmataceae bacterium]